MCSCSRRRYGFVTQVSNGTKTQFSCCVFLLKTNIYVAAHVITRCLVFNYSETTKIANSENNRRDAANAANAARFGAFYNGGSFYLHLLHLDRNAVYNGGSFYLHLDRDAARIGGVFICICCISIEMQFTIEGV